MPVPQHHRRARKAHAQSAHGRCVNTSLSFLLPAKMAVFEKLATKNKDTKHFGIWHCVHCFDTGVSQKQIHSLLLESTTMVRLSGFAILLLAKETAAFAPKPAGNAGTSTTSLNAAALIVQNKGGGHGELGE